mmetsp:Transcript_25059/g.40653  ORF Transcript_25059/g.40653 Transcript_25059/m.40653 type:complete len:208 (-) Transcript_25059:96-719(-)
MAAARIVSKRLTRTAKLMVLMVMVKIQARVSVHDDAENAENNGLLIERKGTRRDGDKSKRWRGRWSKGWRGQQRKRHHTITNTLPTKSFHIQSSIDRILKKAKSSRQLRVRVRVRQCSIMSIRRTKSFRIRSSTDLMMMMQMLMMLMKIQRLRLIGASLMRMLMRWTMITWIWRHRLRMWSNKNKKTIQSWMNFRMRCGQHAMHTIA